MLKINEIFHSIQGEGNSVGQNVIFIRLSGCNLKCSFCDTNHSENIYMSNEQILDIISKFNSNKIVITGGEPLIYQDEIKKFIEFLNENKILKYSFEIETNGTITPNIIDSLNKKTYNIQYNVSPKILNADTPTNVIDNVYPTTIKYFTNLKNKIFKFVVGSGKDVEKIMDFCEKNNIPTKNIYLMPLGKKRKDQLKLSEKIIKKCLDFGVNFSPRVHVLIWNKKKGV